jgi:hypothetical protein
MSIALIKTTQAQNESKSQTIPMEPFHFQPSLFTFEQLFEPESTSFLSRYQLALPPAIVSLANRLDQRPLSRLPDDYDVVCGRGKGNYNREGNKRFRAIVNEHIPVYMAAKTKFEKGLVLNAIIDIVRSQNNGDTRFVKFSARNGWIEISDEHTREKVGHVMREAMENSLQSNKKDLRLSGKDRKALVGEPQRLRAGEHIHTFFGNYYDGGQ